MFFGEESGFGSPDLLGSNNVELALATIQETSDHIGRDQLRWLQCYVDLRLFLKREDATTFAPLDLGETEDLLDSLRLEQKLFGNPKGPLLRDIGLWHALSETITPGAIAKIRDSGTFYHCVVNNPSAVEWGIFWLRQASALGKLWTFKDGVSSLIDKLREQLEPLEKAHRVLIRDGQQVVQIEPGKRHTEVSVRVVDRRDGEGSSYSLRSDRVILALPQLPLQQLNEHFPAEVVSRIESVEPLHLLKAFVVTKDPWWQEHLAAQSYAWLVPTRELHFYRGGESPECPYLKEPASGQLREPCNCHVDPGAPGMIMLYTDQPGIYYWDHLIPPADRSSVFLRELSDQVSWDPMKSDVPWRPEDEIENRPFGLLDLLIRRLLVVRHPGLAYTINCELPKLPDKLDKWHAEGRTEPAIRPDAFEVRTFLAGLKPGGLLGLSEAISDGWEGFSKDQQNLIESALSLVLEQKPDDWLKCVREFLDKRENGISTTDTAKAARDIVAYGIRDWSAPPFGGAAHLWLPGSSYVVPPSSANRLSGIPKGEDPLFAFSLRERASDNAPKNVHICGEAFSGNQGFIEGALQTAEAVVEGILGEEKFARAIGVMDPGISKDKPEAKQRETDFLRAHKSEINKTWQARSTGYSTKVRDALLAVSTPQSPD